MNKKIFIILAALCCIRLLAEWTFEDKPELKFFRDGKLMFREVVSGKNDFAKIQSERTVKSETEGFSIRVKYEFSKLDFAPEYGLFIPAEVVDGATLYAHSAGKKARPAVKIPSGKKWTLKDIVFLAVEKDGKKFALDFEWTGSMAFQHYVDEAWAAVLERRNDGLLIRIPRRYIGDLGGEFNARIALRTEVTDYTALHGSYQAHYKQNLPVRHFFRFTPEKARPESIGGIVNRDDDIKLIKKRFSKAVLVPVTRGIPTKFGGGGWSAGKYLKFNANKSDNKIYAYAAVGGSREQIFTMKLPDGYYFLTFMVKDDSVTSPKKYQVEVNGKKYTIPVKGPVPTATRCVVKVSGGELKIKFLRNSKQWHISAISAVWLCGLGDADIDVMNMKEFQL